MEKMKNKDGKIISYREKVYVDGKAITKTFKRKSDATSWKKSFSAEMQRRKALGVNHIQSISFEDFCKVWLEARQNQGLAITTMLGSRSCLDKHLLPLLGKTMLEKITQTHAQKLIQSTRRNGLAMSTTNNILALFKQILSDAVKLDHLVRNPLMGIKKLKTPPRSLNYWLPHQIEQFLATNRDNPHYPAYVLALNTGMRRGELLGLCWDKVDLNKGRLEIARIRGRYGLKETTKTGVIRYIPLNTSSLQVLKKLAEKRHHPQFVFTNEGGFLPNPPYFSADLFQKAIKRAGVPRIRFHDLRTTYASNFVMAGGDIFALSKLLGHSSVEMTAKKYAGLHPSFMKDVVETIRFTGESENAISPW